MKKTLRSFLFLFYAAVAAKAQPNISLINFATGFVRPVDITHCGDDRLFIVEQRGIIWILDKNGNKLPNAFLNIDPAVGSSGNEQGLLGLAFHPNYANNGYFYVNYTKNDGNTRVSRFTVQANNPNQADPASELVLFEVTQPYGNHNGGCTKFGPDGYLYVGLGDGGSGGDPQGNGQKRSTLLGKMLRIDVDGGTPYAIPSTNPFINDPTTLNEIWALGLRNPWRFSFDRLTGDLWIGDVGQDAWEEIDFQPASSPGGENYGWRCYEGNQTYNTGGCPPASAMTFPVAVYQNAASCSVTGGFVYRGCKYPSLYGHYLYTDYCTGIFWSLTPDGQGGWVNQQLANLNDFQFVSFGENKNGELFVAGLGNGIIYRLVESSGTFDYTVTSTGAPCPSDPGGSISIDFSGNNAPVQVAWNTGATSPQLSNLQAGTYQVTITGGNGCTATESVEIASPIQVNSLVTNENCPGDADGAIALTLTGNTGTVNATWNDGSTGLNPTGLVSGDYSVTISAGGCTWVEQFSVETNQQTPPIPVITISQNALLSTGSGYATYQWLLNGNPIDGATSATFTAVESGQYSVLVTNAAGCEAISETIMVTIVKTIDLPGGITAKLTPNPFRQFLLLELTSATPTRLTVQISDAKGRMVMERDLPAQRSFAENFNLEALPAGVYFIKIKSANGEWTERVVKQGK